MIYVHGMAKLNNKTKTTNKDRNRLNVYEIFALAAHHNQHCQRCIDLK